MGRKKGPGSSGSGATVVVIIIVALASIPKEVWGTLCLLALAVIVVYVYRRLRQVATSGTAFASRATSIDEPVATPYRSPESARSFRIPAVPANFGVARWVSANESVEVAGVTIPGGLIYVGTVLEAADGTVDPALIDVSRDVASWGDCGVREFGYWPSYSAISPTARRAYLDWLASGRTDPNADIGYVFLFFYGLERRVILDAATDARAKADVPVIVAELRRLLQIYGHRSGSFRGYANALLQWIALAAIPDKSYLFPVPRFSKSCELPVCIRVVLGQAAADNAPLPAELALAWTKLDPRSNLRTPAVRCAQEFDALFKLKYETAFGPGLVLPRNRTRCKHVYRAASAGFRGVANPSMTFGDIPDVSVLEAPFRKIQELAEAATKELEAFSRYLGRNEDARASVDGLLLLPRGLWPARMRNALELLRTKVADGMVTMPLQELVKQLGGAEVLSRDRFMVLARALAEMQMGVEPDVLGGARHPAPAGHIVIFASVPEEGGSRNVSQYRIATLTLQLAAAVATSDGEFGAKELAHLHAQIQAWSHLSGNDQRRLLAHLQLLTIAPPSMAALGKRLEVLDVATRTTIATFLAAVAQSDGAVSPAEVRMLEKVYKLLGLDPQQAISQLHAVASGGESPLAGSSKAGAEKARFQLDASRIAALQKDSAAVSAMLSRIFVQEGPAAGHVEAAVPEDVPTPGTFLGLDGPHSSLARLLLSRPAWSRAELSDAAADLELMLDGALERLNDAALDALDLTFFEGDDPVEINPEMMEKMAA